MSAEDYFKDHKNYGRKTMNPDLKWVFKFAEDYARKKNQELQLLVNILTPKKTLKCSCLEPQPNYPEMVWCDKCGYEIKSTK